MTGTSSASASLCKVPEGSSTWTRGGCCEWAERLRLPRTSESVSSLVLDETPFLPPASRRRRFPRIARRGDGPARGRRSTLDRRDRRGMDDERNVDGFAGAGSGSRGTVSSRSKVAKNQIRSMTRMVSTPVSSTAAQPRRGMIIGSQRRGARSRRVGFLIPLPIQRAVFPHVFAVHLVPDDLRFDRVRPACRLAQTLLQVASAAASHRLLLRELAGPKGKRLQRRRGARRNRWTWRDEPSFRRRSLWPVLGDVVVHRSGGVGLLA